MAQIINNSFYSLSISILKINQYYLFNLTWFLECLTILVTQPQLEVTGPRDDRPLAGAEPEPGAELPGLHLMLRLLTAELPGLGPGPHLLPPPGHQDQLEHQPGGMQRAR